MLARAPWLMQRYSGAGGMQAVYIALPASPADCRGASSDSVRLGIVEQARRRIEGASDRGDGVSFAAAPGAYRRMLLQVNVEREEGLPVATTA